MSQDVEARLDRLEMSVQSLARAIEHIIGLWDGLPKSPREWQELLDEHEQELEGDAREH